MSRYPHPCDTCEKAATCRMGYGCEKWRIRYRYRQKQINGFAKKHGIRPTSEPVEVPDPCLNCSRADNCCELCKAKAEWWDSKMAVLRRRLGL